LVDPIAVFDMSNEPVNAADAAINSLFDILLNIYFSITKL
jgi:hypothetical protein